MKTIRTLIISAAILATPFCLFSQTRVTGHMAVTIVAPAVISSNQEEILNSIPISESEIAATLNASNEQKVTEKRNVALTSFRVSGANATYSITLPQKSLTTFNANNALEVSGFSTNLSENCDNSGNVTLGATVTLDGDETYGTYSSNTPLLVTVNYN